MSGVGMTGLFQVHRSNLLHGGSAKVLLAPRWENDDWITEATELPAGLLSELSAGFVGVGSYEDVVSIVSQRMNHPKQNLLGPRQRVPHHSHRTVQPRLIKAHHLTRPLAENDGATAPFGCVGVEQTVVSGKGVNPFGEFTTLEPAGIPRRVTVGHLVGAAEDRNDRPAASVLTVGKRAHAPADTEMDEGLGLEAARQVEGVRDFQTGGQVRGRPIDVKRPFACRLGVT